MCLLWLASNLKGLSWRWRHRVQFLKVFFFNQDWASLSINQPTSQSIHHKCFFPSTTSTPHSAVSSLGNQ